MKSRARGWDLRGPILVAAAALVAPGLGLRAQGLEAPKVLPALVRGELGIPVINLLGAARIVIGSAEGEPHSLLNGVVGAIRTSDDFLVLGDAGNERLLWFTSAGRFVRSTGGRGDGPGEFRMMRAALQCASGVIGAQDGSKVHLIKFTQRGELIGATPLPVGANFDPVVWCSGAEESLVLLNQLRGTVRPGEFMSVDAVIVRTRGAHLDTIARLGTHEYYIGRGVAAMAHVPFGHTTLASGSRAGAFACATISGRCIVFDVAGRLDGEFVVAAPRFEVTSADWTVALKNHLGLEPSAAYRKVASSVLAEIPMRTLMPRFDRILADDMGNLWARAMDGFQERVAQWVVLDKRGGVRGVVRLPRSAELIRAGETFAVVVIRDADGVETVALHEFPKFLRAVGTRAR